jgi:hypothetical protein
MPGDPLRSLPHCIGRHGLDPDDAERECWFDLEVLTLTLLDD